MRVDGTKVAEVIKKDLKKRVGDLISHGKTPKLAIITLGPESSWENYVRQKIKTADEIGIKTVLINLADSNEKRLLKTITEIDSDSNYHGIIVQRPIPSYIDRTKVIEAISASKDVDGFRSDSRFQVPTWLTVDKIMNEAEGVDWTKKRFNIVVIGKGEAAGGPIIRGLKSVGITPAVIDSKTENPDELIKNADVVISCVGKKGIVTPSNIKAGVILIGVGTHAENGKIRGDYRAKDIEKIARAYTTTPGGVGPINLSFLFTNLVTSAEKS